MADREALRDGDATLGGVMSERSGVINLGLESYLLAGAFGAAAGTLLSGSLLVAEVLQHFKMFVGKFRNAFLFVDFGCDLFGPLLGIREVTLIVDLYSYSCICFLCHNCEI